MCQSHTGRLTGLWFLPKPAFGLNTNDDDIVLSSSEFERVPAIRVILQPMHAVHDDVARVLLVPRIRTRGAVPLQPPTRLHCVALNCANYVQFIVQRVSSQDTPLCADRTCSFAHSKYSLGVCLQLARSVKTSNCN